MHVLIVHAHEEPKSFNGARKDTAVQVLKESGHTVEVSDLYAIKFNPVQTEGGEGNPFFLASRERKRPECFPCRRLRTPVAYAPGSPSVTWS